ncbi:MAG: permease prefix domain 1-containing protein, partial [Longimicrobiales bacterium]
MDEELAFHLRMEEERNRLSGLADRDARRTALVAFGGVERFKEEVREARRSRLLEDVVGDVRYAMRTLLKAPGFTVAAVLTLALG